MIVGHVYVIWTNLSRPPKDKIVVCICDQRNLCFWINTKAARHGDGQMVLAGDEHGALAHACHLDCSRLTTFSASEIASARDRGPCSPEFVAAIRAFLMNTPPRTLPAAQLQIALANL